MAPGRDDGIHCYLCNRPIPSGEAVLPRSGYGAITMHLICYERALGAEAKAKSIGPTRPGKRSTRRSRGRRTVLSRRKKNRNA
jgi:hypothetical protein